MTPVVADQRPLFVFPAGPGDDLAKTVVGFAHHPGRFVQAPLQGSVEKDDGDFSRLHEGPNQPPGGVPVDLILVGIDVGWDRRPKRQTDVDVSSGLVAHMGRKTTTASSTDRADHHRSLVAGVLTKVGDGPSQDLDRMRASVKGSWIASGVQRRLRQLDTILETSSRRATYRNASGFHLEALGYSRSLVRANGPRDSGVDPDHDRFVGARPTKSPVVRPQVGLLDPELGCDVPPASSARGGSRP